MYSTIPQLLYEKAQEIPGFDIQLSKDKSGNFTPVTYGYFAEHMLDFASGLLSIGVEPKDHVGLISDNRKEWLTASMGIMAIGAADVPRGSEATVKDLTYILKFAECETVVVEGSYSFQKILECKKEAEVIKNIVLFDISGIDLAEAEKKGIKIYTYDEIITLGQGFRHSNPGKVENLLHAGTAEDTATLIFTSGTTGVPKGVELVHRNFLCQLQGVTDMLPLKVGDRALCVLPVWHIFEREMEYQYIFIGMTLCYSKPVASIIMADMKKVQPQFMPSVPRIWEAIYKAIQKQLKDNSSAKGALFKTCSFASSIILRFYNRIHGRNIHYKKNLFIMKILNRGLYFPILIFLPFKLLGDALFFSKSKEILGGKFKIGISGGGGLPPYLDRYFNSTGIKIVEGYGLTETAPMAALRNYKKPVLGTIGKILPYCEGRVVNKDGTPCKPGQQGVLYLRGDNLMKGYYRQPELTAEVVQEGWFNTGDLVVQTYTGEIIVKGRAKDTIVLRSGENVEPYPIESKLEESPYIAKAVVVGQDRNCLGVLIIPGKDAIKEYAEQNRIDTTNMTQVLKNERIHDLIFKEMERLITHKNGFKPFEKIGKFTFIDKQFEVGEELSAKGSLVRYKINELYKWQIALMYADSSMLQNLQNLGGIIPANLDLAALKQKLPDFDISALKQFLPGKKNEEKKDTKKD